MDDVTQMDEVARLEIVYRSAAIAHRGATERLKAARAEERRTFYQVFDAEKALNAAKETRQ